MHRLRTLGSVIRASIFLLAIGISGLTASPANAAMSSQAMSTSDPPRYTGSMPPIGVSVVADGRAGSGRWSQTIRLTIRSSGSLADASMVVFGDFDHVDAIFAAARRQNPHLFSPALIPLNQEIDLPIDPSTTFALTGIIHQPDTIVQTFTNGVVDTLYDKPRGSLVRVIAFPDGKPTGAFRYPTTHGPVTVKPGGKMGDVPS